MKCKMCGAELADRRSAHGHLMGNHQDDYRRGGFELDRFMDGPIPERRQDRPSLKAKRDANRSPAPAGLRLISGSSDLEREAIRRGFAYIDNEQNIYTLQEVKTEGWL